MLCSRFCQKDFLTRELELARTVVIIIKLNNRFINFISLLHICVYTSLCISTYARHENKSTQLNIFGSYFF